MIKEKVTIKRIFSALLIAALLLPAIACAKPVQATDAIDVVLSDEQILVDGQAAGADTGAAVHIGSEIIFYEEGMGSDYGEGTEADAHSREEAEAHTVVSITQPGTYRLSGTLSAGQVLVDLGDGAKNDESAVVTLILDGVDITCSVAPAVFFYQVYECGGSETEGATPFVDTAAAGASVILADNSVNHVDGSFVARIYEEGTTDKKHKYDGAFYSRMSMNLDGEAAGNGELFITAENEGLDSELHLTVNGGRIYIEAGNDGINTNEDGVSVTTINDGYLWINGGLGEEGDGIDSNGHLVINGGTVIAMANERAPEGGLDADGEILLNGGAVIATGVRNDSVSADSTQACMELFYAASQEAGTLIRIQDPDGNGLLTFAPGKAYQSLTFSSPDLKTEVAWQVLAGGSVADAEAEDGLYPADASYSGGTLQQYTGSRIGRTGGGQGGLRPEKQGGPATPGSMTMPDGEEMPQDGNRPQRPDQNGHGGGNSSGGIQRPEWPGDGAMASPEGDMPGQPGGFAGDGADALTEPSTEFILTDTAKTFSGVSAAEE